MNPFRAKATAARERADRLSGTRTSWEAGMEQSFPLGGGFGRKGGAKRIEASVNRAVKVVEAERRAVELETKAALFDQGRINAQGRRTDCFVQARSEKRAQYQASREDRISAAKAAIEGRDPLMVDPETWATAHGYLGGSARRMIIEDHQARIDGKQPPNEP